MKKWLIFAVIAAMFAMVMFPSCGKDEGGEAVASDVRLTKIGSTYVLTWDGNGGTDYGVYYMEQGYPLNGTASSSAAVGGKVNLIMVGSNQKKYIKAFDTADNRQTLLNTTEGVLNTDGDDKWSVVVDFTTLSITSSVPIRLGVGAASPGGYYVEEFTIAWDIEDDVTTATGTTNPKGSGLEKVKGFFTL